MVLLAYLVAGILTLGGAETSSVAGPAMARLLGASGASVLTIGMMVSTVGALHSLSFHAIAIQRIGGGFHLRLAPHVA